jgi:hypothetical protein
MALNWSLPEVRPRLEIIVGCPLQGMPYVSGIFAWGRVERFRPPASPPIAGGQIAGLGGGIAHIGSCCLDVDSHKLNEVKAIEVTY